MYDLINKLQHTKLRGVASFLSLLTLLTSSSCFAEIYVEPSKSMVNQTINVNAGSYTYYQLQLPAGATLTAKFTVTQGGLDKKIEVLLLDGINFQRFTSGNQYSFLKGTTGLIDGIGSYSVSIPSSGIWFLIVDNQRALLLPRTVSLYAYATGSAFSGNSVVQKQSLEKFYKWTQRQFTLPSFDVHMEHCGESQASYIPSQNRIKLCNELVEELTSKGLNGAVPFILYHELGHAALHLWDYPLSANEDVADEFATVLTILSEQKNEALAAANWWASNTEEQNQTEALYKIYRNDRHTISPQRARNIIGWLNSSDDLIRRWQKILVPKMQTQALRDLENTNHVWVDHQLIGMELSKRAQSNSTELASMEKQKTADPLPSDNKPPALQVDTQKALQIHNRNSCGACHKIDQSTTIASSYKDIAQRYRGVPGAVATLARAIKYGVKGQPYKLGMPPTFMISDDEINTVANWILLQ